jgi:uncharacterized protein YndB with AHSA1/START domain
VTDRVLKPVGEVFEAIVDPDKLSKYFVSKASAPLAAGQRVVWTFADVGGELTPEIEMVERDRHIVFTWDASGQKARTVRTIRRPLSNGWAGALHATVAKPLSGRPNRFAAGVSFDSGGTD